MRHPDCPDVHIGICPKCRRLYERDRLGVERTDKAKAREVVPGAGERSVEPRSSEPSRGGKRVVQSLTNAERQKRWRERRGDEYREWNRERMRRKRNAQKADP